MSNFRLDYSRLLWFLAALVLLTSLLWMVGISAYNENTYWAVYLEGELVGFTDNPQWIDNALQEFQLQLQGDDEMHVRMQEDLQVQQRRSLTPPSMTAAERLWRPLRRRSTFVAHAVAIVVDDEEVALLPTPEAANEVVQRAKAKYTQPMSDDPDTEILSTEVLQDVEILFRPADPDALVDQQQAFDILVHGTEEVVSYEVQPGDTAWGIAQAAGMSVSQLQQANPEEDSLSALRPGDTLKVVDAEPYITVRTEEKTTYSRRIPFDVQTRRDDSYWPWQRIIKQAGRPGEMKVTATIIRENGQELSRDIVSEEKVREPVTQVVVQGTKTVPQHGTGRFILPAEGKLTSGFGPRRGGFHTGIDLAMPVGTPIKAADSGMVTAAGWAGAYGLRIKIDHGEGEYVTLYAHLSRTKVSAGDVVKQGDVIGHSGNTGRSTGPHLHFEIRVNGTPRDPLDFFPD